MNTSTFVGTFPSPAPEAQWIAVLERVVGHARHSLLSMMNAIGWRFLGKRQVRRFLLGFVTYLFMLGAASIEHDHPKLANASSVMCICAHL